MDVMKAVTVPVTSKGFRTEGTLLKDTWAEEWPRHKESMTRTSVE